jgi:Zn-dependent protease
LELILIQGRVLVCSVVVHEVAHGWSALKLGDDTALRLGRLTLNPLPHIDPVGSIVVPLIMAWTMGFPIGWAKPVPVNPGRLHNPNDDHPKVAAAGPASNLLLAFIFAVLLGVTIAVGGYPAGGPHGEPSPLRFLFNMFQWGVFINVILAVFNLLPIPPLDGSWILSRFLPPEPRARYENLRRYGMMIFFGFILLMNYTPFGPLFRSVYMGVANQYFNIAETIGRLGGG